jgi:lipoprotein-anchoring transpeptidase ErfK/SrfK
LDNMKLTPKFTLVILALGVFVLGCKPRTETSLVSATPAPVIVPAAETAVPITLPVLDALFAGEAFKADLKSKLQLTDDQIAALRKISSEAVKKLRTSNAENKGGDAETARQNAIDAIRGVIGTDKSDQLMALARERWNKGSEELESAAAKEAEPEMLPGPNAVPTDTRIIVNIPAFRMDVFARGSLIKSYKVGIGYPQFPLPQGLRKAQQIIFNPTWTPPDSPWVDSMNVTPGQVIEAGSKQNPLGPIKIPIGSPSLIHGGKPLAKIGTFASHGCVGMTNAQVKDFAKVLAQASQTNLTDGTMAAYLKRRTRTQVVKLSQTVPVELRYETIVIEDGKLHVYRDVYDQNTNTEEKLRAVFAAHGAGFDNLGAEEKTQMLDALNAMSAHPKKQAKPSPTPSPTLSSTKAPQLDSARKASEASDRKAEAERQKKLRAQKEIVIEIVGLAGKGYPAAVNLDSGAGTQVVAATTPPPNNF